MGIDNNLNCMWVPMFHTHTHVCVCVKHGNSHAIKVIINSHIIVVGLEIQWIVFQSISNASNEEIS
jgi:hypothetical protein